MQQLQHTGRSLRGRLVALVGGVVVLGSALTLAPGLPRYQREQPAPAVAALAASATTRQPALGGQYPFGAHGFDALLQPARAYLCAPAIRRHGPVDSLLVSASLCAPDLSGHYPFGAHGFDALLQPTPEPN